MLIGLPFFLSMGAMIVTLACAVWSFQRHLPSSLLLCLLWTGLHFCSSTGLTDRLLSTYLRLATWILILASSFQSEWARWSLVWTAAGAAVVARHVKWQSQPALGLAFVAAVVSGCFLLCRVDSLRGVVACVLYALHWHLTTRGGAGVWRHLRDLGVDLVTLFLLLLLQGADLFFFAEVAVLFIVWGILVAAIHMPVHLYSIV